MAIASSKYKAIGIQQSTPTKQTKKNDLYAKSLPKRPHRSFFSILNQKWKVFAIEKMKTSRTNCIWQSNFTSSRIFDFWQSKYHQFHSSEPNIHIMEDRLKDPTHNCLHTPDVVESPRVISPALHLLFHTYRKYVQRGILVPLFFFLFLCPSFNWILRDRSFNVLTSLPNLFSWLFKVIKVVSTGDFFPPPLYRLASIYIYNFTVFIT